MPIYKKDGKSVLFIHIPKAAGTTIDHTFLRAGWSVGMQDGGGQPWSVLKFLRCPLQHFHAALLDAVLDPGRIDVIFAVMRDPLARIQSEYRWRRKHSRESLPPFDAWVAEVFARYEKNPFTLNNHIRPQVEFLLPQARVFAIEGGLPPIFTALSDALDSEISADADRVENASSQDKVNMSGETEKAIRAFYAEDFRLHARLSEKGPMSGRALISGVAAAATHSALDTARRVKRKLLRGARGSKRA